MDRLSNQDIPGTLFVSAPVAELVRVARSRWAVEETFQFAKNETGLDH